MPIQRCPECQGTWLGNEQIEQLGESLEQELALASAAVRCQEPVACPSCGNTMRTISSEDVEDLVVHRCPQCAGLWVAQDELERVGALLAGEISSVIDRGSVGERPRGWSALRWIAWRLRRCFE